jgi:hypothetical protein
MWGGIVGPIIQLVAGGLGGNIAGSLLNQFDLRVAGNAHSAPRLTPPVAHTRMGFTDLHDLHYWFRRISFNRRMFGAPEHCRVEAGRQQGRTE